jgi:hypothetical protein
VTEARSGPRDDYLAGAGVTFVLSNLVGAGLAFWLFYFEWPPAWLVGLAIVAPVAAVAATAISRGAITLGASSPQNRRPSLSAPTFFPMLALARWVVGDVRFVLWTRTGWEAVALACALAGVLTLAIARSDRKEMGDTTMVTLVSCAALVWGAATVLFANDLLPPRQRLANAAHVVDKRLHTGRRSTWYDVTLQADDDPGAKVFPVSGAAFEEVERGARVCIIRAQGAVGLWWKDFEPLQGQCV